MKHSLRIVFLLLVGIFQATSSVAQEYPIKPIKLVVPNAPGAAMDISARILSSELQRNLGQPIVVENKPGAGQVIGYEYVAKQVPADGYTAVFVSVPDLASLPVTTRGLRFDPLKDLPPVIGVVEGSLVFGSSSRLPWKTLNELVAHAKANPGKLNYGAPGLLLHLLVQAFIRDLGLDIAYVPYSAAAAYFQGLVAGDVQMGYASPGAAGSFGEKFRILAVTGERRLPSLPEVPTFMELGYPPISGLGHSLNVPVGTPKAVTDKLFAAATKVLQQPEVKAQYAKFQLEIVNESPEAAAKRLAQQAKLFADIAKKVGMKPI